MAQMKVVQMVDNMVFEMDDEKVDWLGYWKVVTMELLEPL